MLDSLRLELVSYIIIYLATQEKFAVERRQIIPDAIITCTDRALWQETDKLAQLSEEPLDVILVLLLLLWAVLHDV